MRLLLIYLVGPPGAGKTTLLRELTAGYDREPGRLEGCPLIHLCPSHEPTTELGPLYRLDSRRWRVVELGRDREGHFAGTDALSMSIQPQALAAMRTLAEPDPHGKGWLVLAEGDRLANDSFLQGCEEAGWEVRVVYLATALAECARRRGERGGGQNEAWVRGRVTKSRKLAERWGGSPVDGARTPAQAASDLAELIAAWYGMTEPEQENTGNGP